MTGAAADWMVVGLLASNLRSGVLSFDPFTTESFSLDRADEAVEYSAGHSGPFRLTVLTPNGRLIFTSDVASRAPLAMESISGVLRRGQ